MKRVGYWMSQKKNKRLNLEDHKETFRYAYRILCKLYAVTKVGQTADKVMEVQHIYYKIIHIHRRIQGGPGGPGPPISWEKFG